MYQFQFTRNATIDFVNNVDEKTADVQAAYFNNTIRWHVGHVLVITESLLFGYPEKSDALPASYHVLFATGTKPADWQENAPKLPELLNHLKQQSERITQLTDEFLDRALDYTLPFGDFKTYREVFALCKHHESEHLGKMKAMKQVADKVD